MSFITTSGETKIAQKISANAVLTVSHFVFANITDLGSEPIDRVESLPDVADVVATVAVSKQGFVSANKVIYSCLLDTTQGDYQFNWIGLKDENGVLIACEHLTTAIHKIKTVGATQGNNLARNFLLEFSGAQTITGIDTPAETWQFDFSQRLWQIDERERESNFDIYGQGSFYDNGFLVTHISGSSFTVAAGIGYVGGIRCYKTILETITITGLPTTAYVDASLQGDINGVIAVFSVVTSVSELFNYIDEQGFTHYLVAIADIAAADGTVTDLRKLFYRNAKPLTLAETTLLQLITTNLYIKPVAIAPDSQLLITAQEAIVIAGTDALKFQNVNLTLNMFSSGLNGVDVGTLYANTWYTLFLISDGVNIGVIASLSTLAPNFPYGYGYQGYIGVVRIGADGNVVHFTQRQHEVAFKRTNVLTGGQASFNNIFQGLDISSAVPPQAKKVKCLLSSSSGPTNGVLRIAANESGDGMAGGNISFAAGYTESAEVMITDQQLLYWGQVDNSVISCKIDVVGFEV